MKFAETLLVQHQYEIKLSCGTTACNNMSVYFRKLLMLLAFIATKHRNLCEGYRFRRLPTTEFGRSIRFVFAAPPYNCFTEFDDVDIRLENNRTNIRDDKGFFRRGNEVGLVRRSFMRFRFGAGYMFRHFFDIFFRVHVRSACTSATMRVCFAVVSQFSKQALLQLGEAMERVARTIAVVLNGYYRPAASVLSHAQLMLHCRLHSFASQPSLRPEFVVTDASAKLAAKSIRQEVGLYASAIRYILGVVIAPVIEELYFRFVIDLARLVVRRRRGKFAKRPSKQRNATKVLQPEKIEAWLHFSSFLFAFSHAGNWYSHELAPDSFFHSDRGLFCPRTMCSAAMQVSSVLTLSREVFAPLYAEGGVAASIGAHVAWNFAVALLESLVARVRIPKMKGR